MSRVFTTTRESCCKEDNDLYQTLQNNKIVCSRYNTPGEAIDHAGEGSGVLILADGYPEKTTPLDAALFESAARKKLRLYVEYPSFLPDTKLGALTYLKTGDFGAVVERTVVASDAFGPELAKLRIMMIHDCHYLPVEAKNPHLVLGRVEGYDSAVYGLPSPAAPILFEHPRGNLLVATTKLSQFVTARYAPYQVWPHVWKMIIGWLRPGTPAPVLKWTRTVRPLYEKEDPLPTDAIPAVVRRGVEYYRKSRLFIHPSWPPSTGVEPILPDWPVGDGSHGIGECYISKRIFADGSQAVSRMARADCNLEAAMGLACGVTALKKPEYGATAQTLNDLIFFDSIICKGQGRDDPQSPSYGLLASNTGDTAGTYWGDDNARALLSAIASRSLLKSDRWDEPLVRGILANFRTTSPKGFRPEMVTDADLKKNGWRHYYNLDMVDCCPHMQSWLWITYLWLYDKTKYEPLLERARTGLATMMQAYPKWRLEANRVEQERCRMLLPLAWLVRADDTPEHRQWLDAIARYVIDIQDASGAIPQIPGKVCDRNEGYGGGECAITHEAGDPATDALYSINFAFIGMHEAAAATGNERYAASAARMADFFLRTQTQSETHPELDGTWYRGFDFKKWDYWGSDGDAGWGIWSNEIGWTHSWITMTLALRYMKTCLWELTRDNRIAGHFDKYRAQMLPDEMPADRAQIDLSGKWSFQPDRKNEGESAEWFAEDHDVKSWRSVDVPVAFDNCGPDMDHYTGVGWFRKDVIVPDSFRGRRVVLYFEGINYNAKVWVNGKLVGENHDAFLPFTLPINDAVNIGAENKIAVRVDNLRTRGQFPLFEGWYGQGGFLREAYLMATDATHLLHTLVEAEPAPGGGRLRLRAAVTNGVNRAVPTQLQVRLLDANGKELTTLRSAVASIAPGQAGELTVEGAVPGAQSWSPKSPALYTACVTLMSGEKPLDALNRRVGFRRVEVKDARILLNGEPLLLLGFNRHEDSPRTGMAVDLEQAREDFTAMKQMGCNYVRLCHYPHHPGELDLCDELGILVLAENAMNEWGHVDHPDPNGGFDLTPEDAALILDNARRTLRKMVQRDNHHPSIIIWSISNENEEERSDVAEGNAELIQYGKTLDGSRPWTHVSNCHQKPGWESFYRFDDVIVVNVYPSHQPQIERTDATLSAGLPEATKYMENVLTRLHDQFPLKPIVLGEFGYPGGESGPKGARLQTIATEAEFKGLGAPYVAGCALWVYARHPHATQAYYNGGKTIVSPYGYVSHDRKTRLPALSVVEQLFKERAGLPPFDGIGHD